jgi:hypothetical protein
VDAHPTAPGLVALPHQGAGRRSLGGLAGSGHARRGPVLDRVVLAVDEDTDLAWAVELVVEGERLLPDAANLRARTQVEALGASGPSHGYEYAPSIPLPHHWHPYQIEASSQGRIYVQGLVPDLTHGVRLEAGHRHCATVQCRR